MYVGENFINFSNLIEMQLNKFISIETKQNLETPNKIIRITYQAKLQLVFVCTIVKTKSMSIKYERSFQIKTNSNTSIFYRP